MAPTVPFALVGVVQLTAVAAWLGLAGTATLPRRRGRGTAPMIAGGLALAAADSAVALQFGSTSSAAVGWLRAGGLGLLLLAALLGVDGTQRSRSRPHSRPAPVAAGIVVPLGATVGPAAIAAACGAVAAIATIARSYGSGDDRRAPDRAVAGWFAGGLAFAAVAAAAAAPARHSATAALAELAARAAATLALAVAELLIARTALVGKLVGAIVAGVVAMAVGAVAIVGSGVASEVQGEQSARLLSVAQAQAEQLTTLGGRAAVDAQVVRLCPGIHASCGPLLNLFAFSPRFFAAVFQPGHGTRIVAPAHSPLTSAQLLALDGSRVVTRALRRGTGPTGTSGPVLLPGSPDVLAVVAAVPGRPSGETAVSVRPTFVAIYGIGLVNRYLATLRTQIGYDVSVVADGRVIASSLHGAARGEIATVATAAAVATSPATSTHVVPAAGDAPTVAFVPVTAAANGDVRLATLAVSQPANAALAAQRSVLRRLVFTTLAVLVLVALLAVALAQRIAGPVWRLTIAAGRVRRGDLDAQINVGGRDEVGSLARAFEAMTSSLRGLTGDLRAAATNEAALRTRLETVIAAMTDGVIATDGDGLVTSANVEALRLLAADVAAIIGRPLDDVLELQHDGERLPPVGRYSADADLVQGDGHRVPVRVATAPLEGDGGQVLTLGDRSREAEVERMKTQFLANVSHELRTPLTPIKGYAELLTRRRGLEPTQVSRFAEEILTSTERMNRVVALLVDVAALDAGRVTPRRRQVPVAELIDPALASWRTRWPDRAADLRRSVARGLPSLDIDAEWVTKALTELVDNAVKVTAPGSVITVRVEPAATPDRVLVKVVDKGPGIASDEIHRLLGDFSQIDASETRPLGGLGLGLGFVRRVCSRFDLELYVRSRPRRGSEWGLGLPRAVPAAAGDRFES